MAATTARAVVALIGLGANLPADAVYPSVFVDADNQRLDGANKYVIHFDKGATPPVNAFWSITMYNAESFFVANPINRYSVGSWMPLKKNKDGSIDIHVQQESPGKDKASNWLPADPKSFNRPFGCTGPPTSRGPCTSVRNLPGLRDGDRSLRGDPQRPAGSGQSD